MNLADVIARHAARRPQAVAIVEGERETDYRRFDAAIWGAAAAFRAQGIGPGDVVAVALANSALHLVTVFALMRMGAVQTIFSTREPVAMREALAQRYRAKAVIGESRDASIGDLRLILPDAQWLARPVAAADPSLRVEGGSRPWTIARSSGTTKSNPKSFLRTHDSHLAVEVRQERYRPTLADDRYLALIGLDLSFGLHSCFKSLFTGGLVVIPAALPPASDIPALIARHSINRLALTPYHLDLLLRALPADRCNCPGVLDLSVSGTAMPERLRAQVRQRLTPNLFIRYGTNETRVLTVADRQDQTRFSDTVGFALPGIELQIVDEDDRPVPYNQPGLVRVRADEFPTAYLDDPEASARAFRAGWFYPGDLGTLNPEGALFINGRADEVINFDGVKIVADDIESVLLGHPAVAEAAAFPVQVDGYREIPAAVAVLRQPIAAEALHEFCVQRLGARAPVYVGIAAALPKNAMGKVVKEELIRAVSQILQSRH